MIYALGQYKSVIYNIDSILNGKQYAYDKEFSCNLGSTLEYGFIKDTLLWTLMYGRPDKYFRVAIIDLQGNIISKNSDLPPICNTDINDTLFRYIFYKKYSLGILKPNASEFATATTCGLHLEIFTISENEIAQEHFHRYIKPEYTIDGQGPGIKYEPMEGIVQYLCATDKYIYAPWSKDNMRIYPKEVVTFDWDGNAVSRFRVDLELQPEIYVENDDTVLYGVVKDAEGKLNIVKYNLPK